MKVLWTVNTLMPRITEKLGIGSSHSISWVDAMSDYLKKEDGIHLAIATPYEKKFICSCIEGIDYYCVPSNITSWRKVLDSYQPDVIHEYGTEKNHNLIINQLAIDTPVIVSLQGLLSEYQRHYYAGIDISTMLKYTPLRDVLRPSGFFTGRIDFEKRAKNEVRLLNSVRFVEGRSTWDRVSALRINPKLKYYFLPRMLRREFNESHSWKIDGMERHTILVSQGNYPIKGLHFVFYAISFLKKRYPDIKLYIAGKSIFDGITGFGRCLKNGYTRYLYDLMIELDIVSNIYFTGNKSAKEMVELLKTVNVALVSSSIENAPNSLAESMIIGTPSIASFVGGNMDMLKHEYNGYLYCYNEPYMLAEYISRIFDDDSLALCFSKRAREEAKVIHDPKTLVSRVKEIYNDIQKETY